MTRPRMSAALETLGLHRPELRAWAMYDWAITGFYAVIVVAVFPIYFQDVAAEGIPDEVATRHLATITAIALAIAAAMAPILGAITDFIAAKKRLLGTFAGLGVASVGGLYFVGRGDTTLASLLFIGANIGANASVIFYDALLPHIAREGEMDRVSSAGFAIGYLGASAILGLTLIVILQPGWFGFAEDSTMPVRLAFIGVALWWGLFTIPLLRRVTEPPPKVDDPEIGVRRATSLGLRDIAATLRALRRYPHAFFFLIAFFVYNDGVGTIIRMAGAYGREIGLEQGVLLGAIILVQIVAIPFTFLFGIIAGRIGTKPTLFIGLFVYMTISVLAYFMTTASHFFAVAFMVGMVQGGTQALSRSLFASMIPRYESGRFFGFFAVFERFSGLLGPTVFALVGLTADTSRPAILSIIGFFVIGAVLLVFVNVGEGRRAARLAEDEFRARDSTQAS